jgi:hypothetical protein
MAQQELRLGTQPAAKLADSSSPNAVGNWHKTLVREVSGRPGREFGTVVTS